MHHLCTACNGCAMHDECAKRIAGAMSVQCAMGAQRALRVQIRCANQVCVACATCIGVQIRHVLHSRVRCEMSVQWALSVHECALCVRCTCLCVTHGVLHCFAHSCVASGVHCVSVVRESHVQCACNACAMSVVHALRVQHACRHHVCVACATCIECALRVQRADTTCCVCNVHCTSCASHVR